MWQHCRVQDVARVWPPCCGMLGVKSLSFSCNICGCCMMLWSFGQVRAILLRQGMSTSLIFKLQHVATRCNRVAKRTQHVAPNNVAICCIELLPSFGRDFRQSSIFDVFVRTKRKADICKFLRFEECLQKVLFS